jgi:hypothetical protein
VRVLEAERQLAPCQGLVLPDLEPGAGLVPVLPPPPDLPDAPNLPDLLPPRQPLTEGVGPERV